MFVILLVVDMVEKEFLLEKKKIRRRLLICINIFEKVLFVFRFLDGSYRKLI